MKQFIQSLHTNQASRLFERLFQTGLDYVESKVSIGGGQMVVYDYFTDKVIKTTYETSTKNSSGEYILFGQASLREWDGNNIGSHILFFSTETVSSFAFRPISTAYEWIPYHGIKTCFAISGTRAQIDIDGVMYDIYDSLSQISFNEIKIVQSVYGMITPIGTPIASPSRENGVIELNSTMTIKPQELLLEQEFEATDSVNYAIGYSPMWSSDGNAMKYWLLQNGKKLNVPYEAGRQDFSKSVYQFGINSDQGYGIAMITTDADGLKWGVSDKCDRWLNKTQSGAKQKIYFENLTNFSPAIGSKYKNTTKYIWGKSDGFMNLYNAAESEN